MIKDVIIANTLSNDLIALVDDSNPHVRQTQMAQKTGRNDPCPCGSGKKYKKCCLNRPGAQSTSPVAVVSPAWQPSADALATLNQRMREESERRRKYGNIRPLITTVHQGHRFIAVGSRLYFNRNWGTFTDFMLFYIRDVMGNDWWLAEAKKTGYERHPILKWHDQWVEGFKAAKPEEEGLVSRVVDGVSAALVLTAYDLYVLRDHAKLQDEVVQRLRKRDQFFGARYELFVAATFIRAEFSFAYEDESDTKTKHAEFIATHKASGTIVAVEAKARQRALKPDFEPASIRPPVKQLLVSAAEKKPAHPLIVFLEMNLPPSPARALPNWVPEVNVVMADIAQENAGQSPFGAVMFTNRPHIYGEPDEPDPQKHYLAVWPANSPVPEAIINTLGEAARQYGNVPSKFPPEMQ